MRRADRLFKILHFLRGRRLAITAKQISEEFEISTRTVYRDIQDLMNAGAPICGEAGAGYIIDKQYYLPPITFDPDELEAIGLGISMVGQWTDARFAAKAVSAFEKIQAVLPEILQGQLQQITTYSRRGQSALPWTVSFSDLRECIRERCIIHIGYRDGSNQSTQRSVRPLALIFFSPIWVLAGWCELRKDFRHFRLDRIQSMDLCDTFFDDAPDRTLSAYQASQSGC